MADAQDQSSFSMTIHRTKRREAGGNFLLDRPPCMVQFSPRPICLRIRQNGVIMYNVSRWVENMK